jgi:hypothetical protein
MINTEKIESKRNFIQNYQACKDCVNYTGKKLCDKMSISDEKCYSFSWFFGDTNRGYYKWFPEEFLPEHSLKK